MLFCHVTTRVPTDKDQGLLKEKGGTGFPYLIWMDAEGTVIQKQGGRTVSAFQKTATYLELKRKRAAGDTTVAAELLITGAELGDVTPEQVAKDRAGLELDAAQLQRLDAALFHAEIRTTLQGIGRDPAKKEAAGKTFLAHYHAGKLPSDSADMQVSLGYWSLLLDVALAAADVEAYEAGVVAIETVFTRNNIKNPGAVKFIADIKAKLEGLKAPPPPK